MVRARRQEFLHCRRMQLRDEGIFPKVGDRWRNSCRYKVGRPEGMSLLMRNHTEICDDLSESFLGYSCATGPAAASPLVRSLMFAFDRGRESFAWKLLLLSHAMSSVASRCSHDLSSISSLSSMKSMYSSDRNVSRTGCVELNELN